MKERGGGGKITSASVNTAENSACLLEQNKNIIGSILDPKSMVLAQKSEWQRAFFFFLVITREDKANINE